MPYSGPIYFKAVPCSASCYKCPSALASSSRLQPGIHAESISPRCLWEAGDFEWRREGWEACAGIQSLTATLDPSRPSRTSDVHGPHPLPSSSFASLSDPSCSRLGRLANRSTDDNAAEMTPVSHSWNDRSASVLKPERITERSWSSQVATSSATLPDASPRSEPFSRLPSFKRTDDHEHATRNRIWSWVAGVDKGHPPSLDYSASLQVPSDVGFERDLYSSPRTVASSFNTHLSAVTMSPPPPSGSSCSSPLSARRITPFSSASYVPDRTTEECSNVWQLMMDESSSFLASSPCPSSHSSTMGFASTLPREHTTLDDSMYRSVLDRWGESAEWKGEEHLEGEESTSGFEPDYSFDIYPRSPTSSPLNFNSDTEMHPDVLPALLVQQDFSTLMLQSFTLALADATSEENKDFRRFNTAAEAEVEEDAMSILSCPTHLQDLDFDFMDQWSPPALRSSSSASSLDPFQLELFSPTSEQTDPAAVWEAHRTPGEVSESPEFFSSSPFVGWSTSSDVEMKPTLLTMGRKPAVEPFAGVPLYQPQPIRPIPPIEIPLNALV